MTMDISRRIEEIIKKIRPYIQRDGGDVEYLKFEDGIAYVRLLGACTNCASADNTINNVIEVILTEEIPEIVKVINVDATY